MEKKVNSDIVIDLDTRSFVNNNDSEYQKIKKARYAKEKKEREIQDLRKDVNEMKETLNTIMELLKKG